LRFAPLFEALPAVTLLLYLVLSEPLSVLLLFFSALAVHEWGHLLAFYLLGVGVPAFRLTGVGSRLLPTRPLLPLEEVLTVLAGPLVNLLFSLLALRFGRGDFFFLFAAVHLMFALGNLLPFGGCDGERLLRILLLRVAPVRGARLLKAISLLVTAFFLIFFLFLYYLTGNGLCGVFFSLFFLFEEQKAHSNVF
jgi:Zn-dependent protease